MLGNWNCDDAAEMFVDQPLCDTWLFVSSQTFLSWRNRFYLRHAIDDHEKKSDLNVDVDRSWGGHFDIQNNVFEVKLRRNKNMVIDNVMAKRYFLLLNPWKNCNAHSLLLYCAVHVCFVAMISKFIMWLRRVQVFAIHCRYS